MKLRHRAKSVLGTIKQEDCKPALQKAEVSTVATIDTNTVDLTIKQEDTKEHKALLKQHGEFSERDYFYRCDMCTMSMADLTSVLEHRISIHSVKQFNNRAIKHMETEPDIHDPSFYCKSCERKYRDAEAYRKHLRSVHYMVLKPIPSWKAPHSNIIPDLDDSNLYCRACDRTYKCKETYRKHCRYIHEMKSVKSANQSSTSNNTTDSYCQMCDKRFSSMLSYRRHLFVVHKVDSRPTQRKRKDILLPNANDPNFYCRSCERKLANKNSFKKHLMLVHHILQTTPRKTSKLNPDVNDPNNHCYACQKTYPSRSKYRAHLRMVHQITLPALKRNFNRTDFPDPYNPDHYCSLCKRAYTSLGVYRNHCKRVHFMELSHASIVNPDVKIDINHPNFYCAQCEHSFTSEKYFKRHLGRVHHINKV
ncbi:hypothetical protein MBANPS3_010667 [Mucor bainieri]